MGIIPSRFSYHYGFHRSFLICGLDFAFTIAFGFRWVPSSLYTFRFPGLARRYHFTGFAEFDTFSLRVSYLMTQINKSAMYAIPSLRVLINYNFRKYHRHHLEIHVHNDSYNHYHHNTYSLYFFLLFQHVQIHS